MEPAEKLSINIAYIDAANLDKALKLTLKWKMDYLKFRTWLKEKYNVERAYIFIGYISKYKDLYTRLQEAGFTLVFKDVIYHQGGKAKGNCDSDLLMRASEDLYEGDLDQAIVVTSDGDYAPLIKVLIKKGSLAVILSPGLPEKCSILLKRTGASISYINDQRSILEAINEKAPDADETA